MSARTWLFGLTADEWFHLACEGQESEVPPCCGNIGVIRETLWLLLPYQNPDEAGMAAFWGKDLLRAVEEDGDEHDLQNAEQFPLLHRVMAGIREQAEKDAG